MTKPYWINITGRSKGQKFRCSECKGECNCISVGSADKFGYNKCDYKFCPRCGKEMDIENGTKYARVEVQE